MYLYKEVKVDLDKERARVKRGTGVKGGFNKKESAFLLSLCDFVEKADWKGMAKHLDGNPREYREYVATDIWDVVYSMAMFGEAYGVFPNGMSGREFIKADGKPRLPQFNGTLVLTKAGDTPYAPSMYWYGFMIILFVRGLSHPPSCGEVVWEAKFTTQKEARALGMQIAHDLHVVVDKVVPARALLTAGTKEMWDLHQR